MSFCQRIGSTHFLYLPRGSWQLVISWTFLQWRFWLCRVQRQVVQNGRFTSCSGRHQSLPRSNLFLTWTKSPDTCHCFVWFTVCFLTQQSGSHLPAPMTSFKLYCLFIFCYWALCVLHIYIYNWSIIAFYCCVSLHCTEKWITICTHISPPS